jgi:hypothetical protein
MLAKEAQVPYTAEISRSNPTAFVFLVDQSASMEEPVGGAQEIQRKCDAVADALNRLLYELTIRCAKEEGVRDYFHVAVVGYGAGVDSALPGSLRGRDLIPISEVANAPARIEDRTRWLVFFASAQARWLIPDQGESHRCDSRPGSGR